MPLSTTTAKKKKSDIEMIECGVWSGFTVCKNSLAIFLGITISHSRMYLKWISQNLTSFALSLSLWKALSLYPHINMTRLLSSYKLFALTSLEKWYRTGGNRTRFDPQHETHVFAAVIRLFHCFKIGSYKFLEGEGSVYWLNAYYISLIGAIRIKKRCSPSRFAWARLVKQLQLTPF